MRLAIERRGFGEVAQQIDVDMLGAALSQNGIDRAVRFDQAGRFPGADAEHDPTAAPADGLRGLDEALLAVSGVKDKVDAPATGQLRDFSSACRRGASSRYSLDRAIPGPSRYRRDG
jgi:hypothetical protein